MSPVGITSTCIMLIVVACLPSSSCALFCGWFPAVFFCRLSQVLLGLWVRSGGGGCGRQGTSRVSYVNEDLAAGTYDIACFLEHRPQQPWQGLYRALPGQYVLCFVFF